MQKFPFFRLAAACGLSFAFLAPAARADWTLASGSAGNTTMTDESSHTLKVTILDADAHTLRIGQQAVNNTSKNNSNATGGDTIGWKLDFASPIYYVDGDTTNTYTIVEIGSYAFYNNKKVTCSSTGLELTSVTNIGIAAFGYATQLTGFNLSSKLESIGASAFNSTFGNIGFTPQLPPSVKFVGTGAFAHHDGKGWDTGLNMSLSGTIELRGAVEIQTSAFDLLPYLTKVVVGSKIATFGSQGTSIDSMSATKGPFEACPALHTVEWLGAPPASIPKNTFFTSASTASVTNYVYIEHLEAWTNVINASGMKVGALASGNDPSLVAMENYDFSAPAVYTIAPNDNNHKGKIWLALFPEHAPVEGAPVFNSAPTLTQSGNVFTFRANMDEGENCNLFAVFTALDGTAVTNALATEVNGDPDTFYTLTPTGLEENKTYSFAVLGTKGSAAVTRSGVGTFFNGEISVAAPAAFSENGGSGSFTFSRNGTDGDVTIPFTLGGTASEFVNFMELPRSVTIPNGSSSATVEVMAVVDLATGDKTLSLEADGTSLFLCASGAESATATISDWTAPSLSSFTSTTTFKAAGCPNDSANALADFPVLVRLSATRVASIGDSSSMAFFQDGTILPHEVDTWSTTDGGLVWVGMDSLYTNVTLTLAYGNSGYTAPNLAYDLWREAGYVAVLHLGEEGPDFTGSTVQGINGIGMLSNGSSAGSANQVDGAVGSARLIDSGSGSGKARIAVDNFESYLDAVSTMTISFWAKHRDDVTPASGERLFGNRTSTSDQATGLNAWLTDSATGDTPVFTVMGNPTLASSSGLDVSITATPAVGTVWTNDWTHFSFSFDATPSPTFFLVGGKRASLSMLRKDNKTVSGMESTTFAAIMSNGSSVPFAFGNSYDEGGSATSFKGSMDEIRVRNEKSADDWAYAEHATVYDTDFLVSGTSGAAVLFF